MKIIYLCTVITVWALALTNCNAQEDNSASKIEVLQSAKTKIIEEEKDALKAEVSIINTRLEKGDFTQEEADRIKKELAEKRALNIENRIAIIDNKIALIERNGSEEGSLLNIGIGNDEETGGSIFGISFNTSSDKDRVYDRRTSSDLVFAFGLNNAIIEDQSLNDSPYKIGGSRFAEIGVAWKTRVFKESNWLRIKYGVSFQFNGLKPTENRYFVDTGSETELQEFPLELNKSKFRMDHLVIPLHFEFGPSRKIEKETYFRYNTEKSFRMGLGGYAGINLSVRQKLKFNEEGESIKQKLKSDYNTNNFIYGLSGYLGWGEVSLYAKYDLNTIFKDNPIEQRNVSLGVRWDWD